MCTFFFVIEHKIVSFNTKVEEEENEANLFIPNTGMNVIICI